MTSDVVREDFKPLHELIGLAEERGLFVNNLFQIDNNGHWKANVRVPSKSDEKDTMHEFGWGRWPEEALTNALFNASVQKKYSQMMAHKKVRRSKPWIPS